MKKIFSKLFRKIVKSEASRSRIKRLVIPRFAINENKKILDQIVNYLSMKESVYHLGDLKIYVPNYMKDAIQTYIVDNNQFYESYLLNVVDSYIPNNAIIVDVGANIGNHSLYWGRKKHVQSIIAYEPVKETYEILKKNIRINNWLYILIHTLFFTCIFL